MTLIEVLIGAAVGLLGLGLFVSFVVPALRASARGSLKAGVQQEALTALRHLTVDLDHTTPAGVNVVVQPDLTALSVQTIQELMPDGTALWSPNLVVYRWSRSQGWLQRRDAPWSQLKESGPVPITPVQLAQVTNDSEPRIRLAADVKNFTVTPGTASVKLSLSLSRAGFRDELETFEMSRTIALRNPDP